MDTSPDNSPSRTAFFELIPGLPSCLFQPITESPEIKAVPNKINSNRSGECGTPPEAGPDASGESGIGAITGRNNDNYCIKSTGCGRVITMKSSIVSNEIKWLVVSKPEFTDNRATRLCQPVSVPMPPEIGRSTMMSVHLPLNVFVYKGSHRFTHTVAGEMVPYAQLKASFEEPVLMINALKRGRAVMSGGRMGNMAYGSEAGTLFHHVLEIDRSVMLDVSDHIEFTSVGLGYSVLQGLLGEAIARRMLETLGITAIPSTCVVKVPRRITAILHACLPDHLTGEIGILYAQAKILEFLCELARWLDSLSEPPQLKFSDHETLRQLQEELSTLVEGKVPTLNALSNKYGRPGRVLNQGFNEMFGCSIYAYISQQRLAQAHEALLTTDAPMKAIAMNLGYAHVNNFINAFRKKFGYTPGSLRK